MRFIFYCFALLFLISSTHSFAQKPEKILGIAKEKKDKTYYKIQSDRWKKLIDQNPKNGEAWLNYYKAERSYLQLTQPTLLVNDKEAFYNKLQPIIKSALREIGNTFDYYYINGLNSDGEKAIQFLKKAYDLDPTRSEVYGWLMVHYIPKFDESQITDLSKRMLTANTYSNANLKWNYNALQSVEKNGVIISNGDMDAIPKWVLQYGAGVRSDVLCVSKWFLAQYDDYRAKTFKRIGIKKLDKQASDFKNISGYADYLAAEILKRSNRPAYISTGTPIQFFRDYGLKNQIYLVGNALRYSKKSMDNTAVMKKNIEEKFFLEYLFSNFQVHTEDQVVKEEMNLTYLPAFVHMKSHYQSINKPQKVAYYEQLIQQIAKDSGKKEEVLNWFK